jgi:nickel-dependent lactate racemase
MEQIKMRRIVQIFEKNRIDNIPEVIPKEFEKIRLSDRIKPAMQIGITVGSRGIANIPLIIKCVIEEVKKRGGVPFILVAMGSHGGAKAEGQKKILENYGMTEKIMGVPIKSSMDVVELGRLENGLPVYFDKVASEADGIIVVNRIKPHTAFKSLIESGLCKMLSVGLGNHEGASLVHYLGVKGLRDHMVDFARVILGKVPVLCGLGILENAYDETYRLVAAVPEDFERLDTELLKECKRIMPVLPVSDIDILIVQEIGKNVSGTGMDTNIVGGIREYREGEYDPPKIKKIIVLDLTKEADGNALGIGLADLTTRKLYEKIDLGPTYENTITTTLLERAKIPIVCKTEEEAFKIAMKTVWNLPGTRPRIIIIRNTLKLDELYVSESIWEEINPRPNIIHSGDWEELRFDQNGNLTLRV